MTCQSAATIHARTLLHLVQHGDLDTAIDAGLMVWVACADDGLAEDERALLAAARQQLRTAWAARERFRARKARLARRAHERLVRRAASVPQSASSPMPSPPSLPAAAAAILARARVRAGVDSQ